MQMCSTGRRATLQVDDDDVITFESNGDATELNTDGFVWIGV
jgi:hypothetical protein